MKTIATEVKTAPLRQEQGTVFRITEQVCGGQRRGKPAPFCDKQGGQNSFRKVPEETAVA